MPITNMEGGRALLDASSYIFIEASGDSESEYCDTAAEAETETGIAAAVDDAESSCSCGSLSSACSENVHKSTDHIDHGGSGDDFLDDSGEDDGGVCTSEVEDGVVDQCRGGAAAAAELNKSNKGCEDSNMNEREMDRLFWEACLAS